MYPLAHAFAGLADVLGRRNLLEERVVLQVSPRAAVRLRLAAHAFQRASKSDAIYDPAGAVFRASAPGASAPGASAPGASAPSASGAIGAEVDATAQWRIGRHVRLDGGAARFAPGQFMRDTGAARQYSWLYTSLTTTF